MRQSWQSLMNLLEGKDFRIERVRLTDSEIAIEGDFTPAPLARLTIDDQVFASAFLASHGSIKKMEAMFGISYPTVKNRLNRIASHLDIPKVEIGPEIESEIRRDVLEKLDQGDLTFDEAMEALK